MTRYFIVNTHNNPIRKIDGALEMAAAITPQNFDKFGFKSRVACYKQFNSMTRKDIRVLQVSNAKVRSACTCWLLSELCPLHGGER